MKKSGPARLATLALVSVVAACGTSTEPDVGLEIDTEAALADYEAMATALGSDELASFRSLGARTPFGGTPGMALVAGLEAPRVDDGGRAFALGLFRRVKAAGIAHGPTAAPIISDTHRGSTFVYDPAEDDYVVDPERAGAPETGVRFVLYDVDEAGFPIVEEEIGHADLIDRGDASAEDISLRLVVVLGEATVVDYATTLDENGNRGLLTVRGYLVGDRVRLDFDIEAVGTSQDGTQTLDVAWDLRVAARSFSITGSVSGIEDPDHGNGEIDVTVRHRNASIRVDVEGTDGVLDGTIFLNGDIFATVSGPEDAPTIVGQGGQPLTPAEMLVLHRIFDTMEDVFDLLEDLLDPVDDLVVLGIVL